MKTLKFDERVYKIDIKVKTTTAFQSFVLWVMQTDTLSQDVKTSVFTELNSFISEASAQYDKIDSEASAQYDKIISEASAQYNKIRSEAYAQYNKIRSEAYAQYNKIRSEASAQYNKIRSEAYAQYDKKVEVKIKELVVKYNLSFNGELI